MGEIERQKKTLDRVEAIDRALERDSAILIGASMEQVIEWGNSLAAEHVNIQTKDDDAVLKELRHAGAVFLGSTARWRRGIMSRGRAIVCRPTRPRGSPAGSACMSS